VLQLMRVINNTLGKWGMSFIFKPSYGATQLSPGQIVRDPVLLLAFGFGSGLIKIMPGTWGTVAALPLYYGLMQLPTWGYCLATLLVVLVGIWLCDQAATKLGVPDYGGIVWDEIAGLLITLAGLPFNAETVLWGFVLFRAFDIVKPWPIRWLDQHIHGGLGIMLDDVLAGVFAAGVLWGVVGRYG
jgi:phosphatidylglycerophosphatase A